MSIITTLWYVTAVKILQGTTGIDRTIHFADDSKVAGHIELLPPSKEETITVTV